MQYKVLQIQLSHAEVEMVNNGVELRKHVLKSWMFGKHVVKNAKKALAANYYDHVMTVDAKNLEDVYAVGNFMHDRDLDKVQVHGTFSSVSVGDVVVDEDGFMFVVDMFGYEMLPNKIYAYAA
jgi:hypothetical protein